MGASKYDVWEPDDPWAGGVVGDWALPESEWKDGATWPSDGDGRPDWSLEVGAGLGACCEELGVYEETRRVPWMSLRELCQWTRSLAG